LWKYCGKGFFLNGLTLKNVPISKVGLWSLGNFDRFNVIPRGATRYHRRNGASQDGMEMLKSM
jgi:hypothetical protein